MRFEDVLEKLKKHNFKKCNCELSMEEIKVIVPVLEKEAEKKLIKEREYATCPDYRCPNCGRYISPYTENYCSDCGQKLDWEDEDILDTGTLKNYVYYSKGTNQDGADDVAIVQENTIQAAMKKFDELFDNVTEQNVKEIKCSMQVHVISEY